MKLSELLSDPGNSLYADIEVKRIDLDSRQVEAGSLFVACKGQYTDGHKFVKDAEDRGAVAAIVSYLVPGINIPQIIVPDTRACLAPLSSTLYQTKDEESVFYAVTGTDGKTTTSHMLRQIIESTGQAIACIGTSGAFSKDQQTQLHLTTPEAPELHRLIRHMQDKGIHRFILETSSHALDQGRVDGLNFRYAIFTNFTSDHLDYHLTRERYLDAKLRLFQGLSTSDLAILNADDALVMSAKAKCQARIITYGIKEEAMYFASNIREKKDVIHYDLLYQGDSYPVILPCRGRFNVYNSLAALAAAHQSGIDLVSAVHALQSFRSVGGRQEVIDLGQNYTVLSDFAHTTRAITHNKIRVLATAAANRDRTKRPLIGQILDQYADYIVLTSGIVEDENPKYILDEVLTGIKEHEVTIIFNRLEALKRIIDTAEENDIILILGIGDYQNLPIGGSRIYYNEIEAIKLLIAHRQMNDALSGL